MAGKAEDKRLFLTGASGLLGRAILRIFREANWTVFGTALSRYRKYHLQMIMIELNYSHYSIAAVVI